MRLAIDLIVGINAVAGVVGFLIRHSRRSRQPALAHLDYQEKLRRENAELDRERDRLGL